MGPQVTNKKLQMTDAEIQAQGERFAELLNEFFQGRPCAVIAYAIVRVVNNNGQLTRDVNHYTLQAYEQQQRARLEFESYGPVKGTA